jgi:cytochrome c biogenesis factor
MCDYLNYNNFYNLIENNIIYNTNVFWKILYYFNNNNNNILIFLLLVCLFVKKETKLTKIIIFLFALIVMNYRLSINSIFYELKLNVTNTTLVNGVLLIHPFMMYMTYYWIVCKMLNNYKNYFLKFKNKQKQMKTNENLNIHKYIYTNVISIMLGGYWAQQELNWGGWWNWDYVEIIPLSILFYMLWTLHLKKKFNFGFNHLIKINSFLYILLFFIVVRCDIFNSVHSFNTFTILDKYIYYLYLYIISVLFYIIYNKKLLKFKINYHTKQTNFVFIKQNLFLLFNQFVYLMFLINLIKLITSNSQITNLNIFLKFILIVPIYIYVISNPRFKKLNLVLCWVIIINDYAVMGLCICLNLFLIFKKNIFKLSTHIFIILLIIISETNYTLYLTNLLDCVLNTNPFILNTTYVKNNCNHTIQLYNLSLDTISINANILVDFNRNWILGNENYLNTNIINFSNNIIYKLKDFVIITKSFNLLIIFLIFLIFMTILFFFLKKLKLILKKINFYFF